MDTADLRAQQLDQQWNSPGLTDGCLVGLVVHCQGPQRVCCCCCHSVKRHGLQELHQGRNAILLPTTVEELYFESYRKDVHSHEAGHVQDGLLTTVCMTVKGVRAAGPKKHYMTAQQELLDDDCFAVLLCMPMQTGTVAFCSLCPCIQAMTKQK